MMAASGPSPRKGWLPDGAGRSTRRGATLAELLLVATLGALVAGGALRTLIAQRRATDALVAGADARAQLRHGLAAVVADLRGAVASEGGVALRGDTAIELRTQVGVGFLCASAAPGGATRVAIAAVAAAATGAPPLAWNRRPDPGDEVFLLDEGASASAGDDRWRRHQLRAIGLAADACADAPGTLGPRGWWLTLDPALPATVRAHAPLRFVRAVRWNAQRSGDGSWTLALRERGNAGWSAAQPVAGPLSPRTRGAPLRFVALDEAGAPLGDADSLRVAAVTVTLRAERGDTLAMTVAMRGGGGP